MLGYTTTGSGTILNVFILPLVTFYFFQENFKSQGVFKKILKRENNPEKSHACLIVLEQLHEIGPCSLQYSSLHLL